MYQEIIVIIILAAACVYAVRKIYKSLFKPGDEFVCTTEKCDSCPFHSSKECESKKKL